MLPSAREYYIAPDGADRARARARRASAAAVWTAPVSLPVLTQGVLEVSLARGGVAVAVATCRRFRRPPQPAVATSKRRILSRGAASQPRPRAALWPVTRAKLSMYKDTVENY